MLEEPTDPARRSYARIAGFMFLFVNVADLIGVTLASRIRGSGDFGSMAARILASERLFRSALLSLTLGWAGTVLLAYALFVTLEPIDRRLAQLALLWRLAEAAIGGTVGAFNFAALQLYAGTGSNGPFSGEQLQALVKTLGTASISGFYIATIFFSPGSLLFFWLLFRARYIPRPLAALGLAGSVLALALGFGILIAPERQGILQVGWGPLAVTEFITGFWLLIAGIRQPPGEAGAHSVVSAG